ncbi:MAG: hypothetical protein IKW74_07530, partial [Thermoguttaceae bacterium]|nr:hypothetical protein [Thermoguttaceae bacterium]
DIKPVTQLSDAEPNATATPENNTAAQTVTPSVPAASLPIDSQPNVPATAPEQNNQNTPNALNVERQSQSPQTERSQPVATVTEYTGAKTVKFEKGPIDLPVDSGQFWVTYEILPYTNQYPTLTRPQQTIIDWILADTGENFWHQEPMGILTADREKLYVYHNASVQQYVSNVLDRFVDPKKKTELFRIRIIALRNPDWRVRLTSWLRPYPMTKLELQGWLISRENYGKVIQEIEKRTDFVELNAGQPSVPNGEKYGWAFAAPARQFVRDIQLTPETASGYTNEYHAVDEGCRIEVTPLLSTHGEMVEFLMNCQSTAVEKFLNYSIRVPTASAPRQQMLVEVPQTSRYQVQCKTSFPGENIFLVDLGMIPLVLQEKQESSTRIISGISKLVTPETVFCDVLIFIEPVVVAVPTQ